MQTFTTIRLLADRGREADAYRAYAYFRWMDDWLDSEARPTLDAGAFVKRQQRLIESCYASDWPQHTSSEEALMVDLIRGNPDPRGPLAEYIFNMLKVMGFDAQRRGRVVSQNELNAYQHALAVAVTEAVHYFIGRDQEAPMRPERYLAVTAAHITHMLRDTYEDLDAGYFNIPGEYLRSHALSPYDVDSPAYIEWIRARVQLAREYFRAGRCYLRQVRCLRCRIAARGYVARFESVLDTMESDGFSLRRTYPAPGLLHIGRRLIGATSASVGGLAKSDRAYRAAPPDGAPGT